MPKIKKKTETITTQDKEGITPNKFVMLGEIIIKETKTPKGEKIKINHDKVGTTTLGLTSLALYMASMDIILTTTSKFPISNE
jgi:hypothetical protein